MALRLGFINLIVCPIGDVPIPLSCCRVSADKSYKALQGKYKMSWLINKHLSKAFFMGLPANVFEGLEL
jgi:hypothetical protein